MQGRTLLNAVGYLPTHGDNLNKNTVTTKSIRKKQEFRPGRDAAEAGHSPAYSVFLVPGFVTSGLELWKGPPCADHLFRHRVWGSMVRAHALLHTPHACMCVHAQICVLFTSLTPPDTHARHQGMMTTMLRNITCWLEIMHLDPLTGGDPPGVKLRAMQVRGACACAYSCHSFEM